MSHRIVLCASAVLLLTTATAKSQETLPVAVFVTHLETPLPAPVKPEQHGAAYEATRREMADVREKLHKQHGSNTKKWPPEAWQAFNAAEDAHMMTLARRSYERPETQLGLATSVEDVVRGARGMKEMALVTIAEEAQLLVQITGRRTAPRNDPYENKYFVRYRLAPGGKMTRERFIELTRDYNWKDPYATVFARPNEGAVYVDLEAGSPASYKNAAAGIQGTVRRFIRARMDPSKRK